MRINRLMRGCYTDHIRKTHGLPIAPDCRQADQIQIINSGIICDEYCERFVFFKIQVDSHRMVTLLSGTLFLSRIIDQLIWL
jgi:hypothetical protein